MKAFPFQNCITTSASSAIKAIALLSVFASLLACPITSHAQQVGWNLWPNGLYYQPTTFIQNNPPPGTEGYSIVSLTGLVAPYNILQNYTASCFAIVEVGPNNAVKSASDGYAVGTGWHPKYETGVEQPDGGFTYTVNTVSMAYTDSTGDGKASVQGSTGVTMNESTACAYSYTIPTSSASTTSLGPSSYTNEATTGSASGIGIKGGSSTEGNAIATVQAVEEGDPGYENYVSSFDMGGSVSATVTCSANTGVATADCLGVVSCQLQQ